MCNQCILALTDKERKERETEMGRKKTWRDAEKKENWNAESHSERKKKGREWKTLSSVVYLIITHEKNMDIFEFLLDVF